MTITAKDQTFAEALTQALNQIVASVGPTNATDDASLAIPLRAREAELPAVVEAMVTELLSELGEGRQIVLVQIDGMMKRDGEYICWGYAYAAPNKVEPLGRSPSVRDSEVIEEPGHFEIRFTLDKSGGGEDCE
jgi:hypothetical protein